MKKPIFTLCMLVLLFCGCQNSSDNNRGLDYETLEVNFEGKLSGNSWNEGDGIGIFASCTRNDEPNIPMSSNVNAKYVAAEGETSLLTKATDADAVIALSSDHNFQFYAYYPYAAAAAGRDAFPVQIPSVQSFGKGVMNYGIYVAARGATTVVPTIVLNFKGAFSILNLFLPSDILDDDGNSVVRKLVFEPAVPANFNGPLADKGTYNFETGAFTSDNSARYDRVEIDFGTDGLALTESFTRVSLAVMPFTVPEGGMNIVLTDLDDMDKTVTFLSKEEDRGTVLAAGESLSLYLASEDDGVIPVTFPVEFPINVFSGGAGTGNFTAANYPGWPSNGANTGTGLWICPSQNQAYAQWTRASSYWMDNPSPEPFTETINSGTTVSSPGVKGIWTGDYLEFVIPVKKFAANSTLTMKFPFLTRLSPIFWDIEYLDGEEWKCNRTMIDFHGTAREATFTQNTVWNTGWIVEHSMVFTNPIRSGYIKVRLKCVDGSLCSDTPVSGTVPVVSAYTKPHTNAAGTAFDAPFYFYMAGSDVKAVSFTVN